jgi:hypothetical protein
MTKLDLLMERVRQLPEERQELIAAELEFMLEHDGDDLGLTEQQERELERRLADPDKEYVSHEEVFERLLNRP